MVQDWELVIIRLVLYLEVELEQVMEMHEPLKHLISKQGHYAGVPLFDEKLAGEILEWLG